MTHLSDGQLVLIQGGAAANDAPLPLPGGPVELSPLETHPWDVDGNEDELT